MSPKRAIQPCHAPCWGSLLCVALLIERGVSNLPTCSSSTSADCSPRSRGTPAAKLTPLEAPWVLMSVRVCASRVTPGSWISTTPLPLGPSVKVVDAGPGPEACASPAPFSHVPPPTPFICGGSGPVRSPAPIRPAAVSSAASSRGPSASSPRSCASSTWALIT